jgi:hypothetical protein
VGEGMTSTSRLKPGDLVRPKWNQHVAIWPSYVTRECPDGITRASMQGQTTHLIPTGLALVISVPCFEIRKSSGTHLVGLWVLRHNRFAYAWDSSLYLL